jgi:peptidyl-prolyl cis-trans isomerase C
MKLSAFVLIFSLNVFLFSVVAANTNSPAPAPSGHDPKQIIARVNGKEVHRDALDQAMQAYQTQLARRGHSVLPPDTAQLESNAFEDVVSRELLLQEATAHPSTNVNAKTAETLEKMKSQLGSEEDFKKALQENGVTQDEFVARLRENVLIQESMEQTVDRSVKMAPDEAQDFYKSNSEKFREPETVRASHILIRVPADASAEVKQQKKAQIRAARSLIQNGEKFADVAKKYSEDTYSARNGGDLGAFPRGAMVPEFEQTAFSLKPSEMSDVIETKFGYHIIMVTEHTATHQRPFAEAKDDIEKYLRARKGSEVVQQHVRQLRDKAKIETLITFAPAPASNAASSRSSTNATPKPPPVETPPVAAPRP